MWGGLVSKVEGGGNVGDWGLFLEVKGCVGRVGEYISWWSWVRWEGGRF